MPSPASAASHDGSNSVSFRLSLKIRPRSEACMKLYDSALSCGTSGWTAEGKEYNVDELLLLHVRNGADYIIRVFAQYEPTCVGLSLARLADMRGPVRSSLGGDEHGAGDFDAAPPTPPTGAPKEVSWLLHILTALATRDARTVTAVCAEATSSDAIDALLEDVGREAGVASVFDLVDTGAAPNVPAGEYHFGFLDALRAMVQFFMMLPKALLPLEATEICELTDGLTGLTDGLAVLVRESVDEMAYEVIKAVSAAIAGWTSVAEGGAAPPALDAVDGAVHRVGALAAEGMLIRVLCRSWFHGGTEDEGTRVRRCQFMRMLLKFACRDALASRADEVDGFVNDVVDYADRRAADGASVPGESAFIDLDPGGGSGVETAAAEGEVISIRLEPGEDTVSVALSFGDS